MTVDKLKLEITRIVREQLQAQAQLDARIRELPETKQFDLLRRKRLALHQELIQALREKFDVHRVR